MDVIKFNLSGKYDDLDNGVIEKAVDIIQKGGSIVYPTDTVYGLGVNATRKDSIERLFKIKKRPFSKPIPIIVKDMEMAKSLVYLDKKKEEILNSLWPGPVTVILNKRVSCKLPSNLTANKDTIGLRITDHPFVDELMQKLEVPISATSANISGESPMHSSREVIQAFEKSYPRPDFILDAGDLVNTSPSTLVDLTTGQPRILRMGPGTKTDLLKILEAGK